MNTKGRHKLMFTICKRAGAAKAAAACGKHACFAERVNVWAQFAKFPEKPRPFSHASILSACKNTIKFVGTVLVLLPSDERRQIHAN